MPIVRLLSQQMMISVAAFLLPKKYFEKNFSVYLLKRRHRECSISKWFVFASTVSVKRDKKTVSRKELQSLGGRFSTF